MTTDPLCLFVDYVLVLVDLAFSLNIGLGLEERASYDALVKIYKT